jgi:membrane associated rhomboid family serine protease
MYLAEYRRTGSRKIRETLEEFNKNMVMSLRNIQEGRSYTILTSTFTHFNTLHLAFNMMTLWSFGRPLVAFYGVPTFIILWVGSGIAGGALQAYAWSNNGPYHAHQAVGASGSIFGMLAVLTCITPKAQVALFWIPMTLRASTILTVAFSVAAISQDWLPFLGHWDHLGGMAFGAFWWLIALRRGRMGPKSALRNFL